MDKEFLAKSVVALAPITLGAVVFCLLSMATYGFPNASYDVMLTHYYPSLDDYSPLLPATNIFFRWFFGEWAYPYYFIMLEITVCFIIPYILLYEITKQHRYGLFFIYGSTIPVANFITGTLPQAIIINLILLLVARRGWFWLIAAVALLTHTFGIVFIAIARLTMWFDD